MSSMLYLLARWGRLRSKLVDEQRVSNSCPPAFPPMPRARLRLFLALWLVLAVHSSPEGPQNRRYQQPARSLADAGTFLVPPDASEAPDFLQTPVGKYAVVAPGLPLLLAPFHATLKAFLLPIHAGPEHPLWPKLFSIAACGLIIAPLLALAGVALFEILEQLEPRVSEFVAHDARVCRQRDVVERVGEQDERALPEHVRGVFDRGEVHERRGRGRDVHREDRGHVVAAIVELLHRVAEVGGERPQHEPVFVERDERAVGRLSGVDPQPAAVAVAVDLQRAAGPAVHEVALQLDGIRQRGEVTRGEGVGSVVLAG